MALSGLGVLRQGPALLDDQSIIIIIHLILFNSLYTAVLVLPRQQRQQRWTALFRRLCLRLPRPGCLGSGLNTHWGRESV